MSSKIYQNAPVYKNYKGISNKPPYNCPIIIYSVALVHLNPSYLGKNQV